MNWLNIVRWKNLLIILFIFSVFRYGFLVPQNVALALTDFQYYILAFSVMFISAAGYVINDIHDRKADRINKPNKNTIGVNGGISEKKARTFYWLLNALGIALGYFMGYTVGLSVLGTIHFIALLLLWMYSTDFKHRPFIGNFIIASLAALVIIVIPLFDVAPANKNYIDQYYPLFYIFGVYAFFAFLTSLIREIIKDAEDHKGDKRMGSKTLAVLFSLKIFKVVVNILSAILLISLVLITYFFRENIILVVYLILFLVLPILLNMYWVATADHSNQWRRAATLMKFIMIFGISSVLVITFAG